jgi:uncharacterized damage-inducible protein DinB
MSDMTPNTTAELLSRVDQAWKALEGTIDRLSPAELSDVRDPAGWAVKDHLMHVAAWEDAFLARLAGRPTHEALGLDEAVLTGDEDAENAAIFELHRRRPLAEVLDAARASHRAVRNRLAALSDRAISGPIGGVLPPGAELAPSGWSRPRDDTPAAAWIGGNTWEHYDQHHGWIKDLVNGR